MTSVESSREEGRAVASHGIFGSMKTWGVLGLLTATLALDGGTAVADKGVPVTGDTTGVVGGVRSGRPVRTEPLTGDGFGRDDGGFGTGKPAPKAAPRGPRKPVVYVGEPEGVGALDGALLGRGLLRSRDGLERCYQQALKKSPVYEGSMSIQFEASAAGKPGEVRVVKSSAPPAMERCVVAVFKRMKHSKPSHGLLRATTLLNFRIEAK